MSTILEILKAHHATRPLLKAKLSDFLSPHSKFDDQEIAIAIVTCQDIADVSGEAYIERGRIIASIPELQRAAPANDPHVVDDLKIAGMVAKAFRCADDPTKPIFPSARAAREALTTGELESAHNLFELAQARGSKHAEPLDDGGCEVLATFCAASIEAADALLGAIPRDQLHAFVGWLCSKYKESKPNELQASAQEHADP